MSIPIILCIDDEELGLQVRRVMLEREGYTVLTACDGTSGLAIFDTQPVSAVILDYAMPGLNGGQVAALMRRRKPQVPILMLSAYLTLPEETMRLVDLCATKGEETTSLIGKLKQLLIPGKQP